MNGEKMKEEIKALRDTLSEMLEQDSGALDTGKMLSLQKKLIRLHQLILDAGGSNETKEEKTHAEPVAINPEKKEVQTPPPPPPVSGLGTYIGLNDRFRFVNELFGGNSNEFSEAVNQLDKIEAKHEADEYIARLSEVYNWNNQSRSAKDFMALLSRKFKG
jgi:hypothetical protein